MKNVTFKMQFIGKGWSNKLADVNEQHDSKPDSSIITRITGPEPGYISTSKIVTNCALVLLRERDKIPVKGGVITPGVAFSRTSLFNRLNSDGITFETLSKLNSNL
jgi:short subunit dehydrogenase-like uncharacterized protein